ncbi:SDR family oxidoreductase [Francisella sp. 19X1-34]|uniref:SDR family NAD(P)-dependent oxidoreductase n=1 Tax=Francisella sp. 19X1-34 TaxID=3087177 RepID=UPI002E355143|nr:SDR family oxidoreductase [Francisella sp. 19X1-34]MED7789434.1 SDR family oxidoreductase [Francisella sp. 19X1-34]
MGLFDLKGKTALIMGGSSGIGRTIAEAFCEYGANIAIASNDFVALEQTKKDFEAKFGVNILIDYFDATSCESINNLELRIEKHFKGSLNILVHSVGIVKRTCIDTLSLNALNEIMNIDTNSAFIATKIFHPLLKKADFGRVIFISSYFASHFSEGRVAYSMSKAAMNALMKTVAIELSRENITANSISPGGFLTDINKDILTNPEILSKIKSSIPMKRIGRLEEIKTTALYLASQYSSYTTGQDILLDGGMGLT